MKTVECVVHGVIVTNAVDQKNVEEIVAGHRSCADGVGCYFDISVYDTPERRKPEKGTVSKME